MSLFNIIKPTAPSVTRFPRIKGGNGKKYRIRLPRPTLRKVESILRVLARRAKSYEPYARKHGILTNPFRSHRDKMLAQLRQFEKALTV